MRIDERMQNVLKNLREIANIGRSPLLNTGVTWDIFQATGKMNDFNKPDHVNFQKCVQDPEMTTKRLLYGRFDL
jgi:hypothetical protein